MYTVHQYIYCAYFLAFRTVFTNYCHLYLFVDTSQLAQLEEHMEGEQKGMARLLTKWQLSVLPHLLGRSYWEGRKRNTADSQKSPKTIHKEKHPTLSAMTYSIEASFYLDNYSLQQWVWGVGYAWPLGCLWVFHLDPSENRGLKTASERPLSCEKWWQHKEKGSAGRIRRNQNKPHRFSVVALNEF